MAHVSNVSSQIDEIVPDKEPNINTFYPQELQRTIKNNILKEKKKQLENHLVETIKDTEIGYTTGILPEKLTNFLTTLLGREITSAPITAISGIICKAIDA
eukprot:CAMPEP_0117013718 /NCGR_PEP_ID=MMETSP0472-20121206/11262_1 /TAXON_ID=693140 ORGANISM="Tiarina fusus, Strain LIS" /NCGR_SAMPLE_ID=MMETSP0472 /ASSEMBLY_ACC=CAM_ASM_000603 /LENGTH=100 /DNA_ID=CAMNT_0004717095 /DNA_START=203 /DNA_END=501 /DNA_ORIENTATION=+